VITSYNLAVYMKEGLLAARSHLSAKTDKCCC